MRALNRKTIMVMAAACFAIALAWTWRVAYPESLRSLQDLTFDTYQRIKPRQPLGQPIRIVEIDEQSIAKFGQWPWPRTKMAAIVDKLSELGAATIALDIVFSEADRTGPGGFASLMREENWPGRDALEMALANIPENDAVLADSIAKTKVVLGFFNDREGRSKLPERKAGINFLGEDPTGQLPQITGAIASLPILEQVGVGQGSISLADQDDDIVRRVPMFTAGGGGIYPALAIDTLRVVQDAKSFTLRTSMASGEISSGKLAMTQFKVGDFEAPVDENGRFLIYYSHNDPKLYLSAADLLQLDEATLEPLISGHIVFIGATAAGLRDIRTTSLGEQVPGVFMHAQIVDQILSGSYLTRPDWARGAEIAVMLLLSLLMVAILPLTGATVSALAGALLSAIALGCSWIAFSWYGLLIDPVFPMLTGLGIFILTTLMLYAFTEGERRFVRGAFQRYLAPDLLAKLEKNPESLKLGGEIRDMTLMFMDIRGFTPISEKLKPQELVTFLNKLLSPLSEAILAHEGAIDKYIGDSIMAFWNAPLDVADHPRKAARAALMMMEVLEKLNAQDEFGFHGPHIGLGDVQIGIGINTGEGCVGNMGSTNRFDYSVVGDTVNVAARIESTTKPAGWPILLSETTAFACPDFAILKGGKMPLKGKSQPATLYALVGDETMAASTPFKAFLASHNAFLSALESGATDAVQLSQQCRDISPVDIGAFHDALIEAGPSHNKGEISASH